MKEEITLHVGKLPQFPLESDMTFWHFLLFFIRKAAKRSQAFQPRGQPECIPDHIVLLQKGQVLMAEIFTAKPIISLWQNSWN